MPGGIPGWVPKPGARVRYSECRSNFPSVRIDRSIYAVKWFSRSEVQRLSGARLGLDRSKPDLTSAMKRYETCGCICHFSFAIGFAFFDIIEVCCCHFSIRDESATRYRAALPASLGLRRLRRYRSSFSRSRLEVGRRRRARSQSLSRAGALRANSSAFPIAYPHRDLRLGRAVAIRAANRSKAAARITVISAIRIGSWPPLSAYMTSASRSRAIPQWQPWRDFVPRSKSVRSRRQSGGVAPVVAIISVDAPGLQRSVRLDDDGLECDHGLCSSSSRQWCSAAFGCGNIRRQEPCGYLGRAFA